MILFIISLPPLFHLLFFFLSGFSFTNIHESQDCRGRGEGISLTRHCHFHPLHRHLDISRATTAESSPLHVAGSRSRTKSLTTKLRALNCALIYSSARPHLRKLHVTSCMYNRKNQSDIIFETNKYIYRHDCLRGC